MINIAGYELYKKVYEGNKTIIYSGIRLNDGIPLLPDPLIILKKVIRFLNN